MKGLYRLEPLFPEVMKKYPRLLSLKYHFVDPEKTKYFGGKNGTFLMNPAKSGFQYASDGFKYHNLSESILDKYGGECKDYLNIFMEVIESTDLIVTFDSSLTLNLLISEYYKNGFDVKKIFGSKKQFCMMKHSKDICKLKYSSRSTDYRNPTLVELFNNLYKTSKKKILPGEKLSAIKLCYEKFSELHGDKIEYDLIYMGI